MDIFIAYNEQAKAENSHLNADIGNAKVEVSTLPKLDDLTKIYEHHVVNVIEQIQPSVEDGSIGDLTEAEFRHKLKGLAYFDAVKMLEKLSPKSPVFEQVEHLDWAYKKSRL